MSAEETLAGMRAKTDAAWEAAQEAADELHIPTSASLPQHELEHAVALERETIAKYVEDRMARYRSCSERRFDYFDGVANEDEALAHNIRNGHHWRQS